MVTKHNLYSGLFLITASFPAVGKFS